MSREPIGQRELLINKDDIKRFIELIMHVQKYDVNTIGVQALQSSERIFSPILIRKNFL